MSACEDQKMQVEAKEAWHIQTPEKKDPISIEEGTIIPLNEADDSVKDSFVLSSQQGPFATPADVEYWSQVYEEAKYEGRHRFDPSFQWSPIEEKKLVRKVRVLNRVCLTMTKTNLSHL